MRSRHVGRIAVLTAIALSGAGCNGQASPRSRTSASTPPPSTSSTIGAAEARILVEVDGTASTNEARALAPLATSPSVLIAVMRDLGLSVPMARLAHMISASADTDDGYINIRTTGARSVQIANSDARALILAATHSKSGAHLDLVQPAS